MGLQSDIQEALAEAMDDDLFDVVASFNYKQIAKGTVYDNANDNYTDVPTTEPSKGIFASFPAKEIDGTNVKSTDEKLIINGADLPLVPEVDDTVTLLNGTAYRVVNSTNVMGGGSSAIVYILQVRK